MRILVKLYPVILIAIFILSCIFSGKLSAPLINNYFAYPVNESPYPKSWMKIAAFSSENVYITDLENIEEFKATHSNFSFLLPKEKEAFFKGKLLKVVRDDNYKNTSNIIIEQIAEDKQRIELRIIGSKSSGFTKYEATDKEIFPLTYTELGLDSAFYMVIIGFVSGVFGCGIFNFLFKKYIKSKVTLN